MRKMLLFLFRLEAERQYMKKHHKAVHAAILVMKDLKAK